MFVELGLSPERFTLELTESAVSRGLDRDLQTLKALRARGFTLSIDDFGTGESSLSRIRVAEFQEVKIDRSFVRHLDEEHDPVLVASIINLAQALGARVVAEGVESEAAARFSGSLAVTRCRASSWRAPSLPKSSPSGCGTSLQNPKNARLVPWRRSSDGTPRSRGCRRAARR